MTKSFRKKKQIRAIKSELVSRINQCKSLTEVKKWKKTFSYHDVLKNDEDWDYHFLLDLIEFKLKRMSQYFHTHRIVEHEDWYGTLCDRAINILKAGYNSNIVVSKDLGNIYVNPRNKNRFLNKHDIQFIEKYQQYYLPTIRAAKANSLFWKFLQHYIEQLWD